jgi:hypothetical protein
VIKPPRREERLHRHAGPAVVFADYDDMAARIDDPDLDVDENSVLVLQSAGPQGAPGMPEWGQLPIPKKHPRNGACGTWCGSPTPGCRARATVRACCTSRRRATSAARWPWCAPAT